MSDNTSNNKRIAKNSVFMTIRMLVVLLISLFTTRVVIDTLGIEDYGIYNVVAGFVSMFTFLSTAMNNGIQRFYNYEFGKNGKIGIKRVYNAAIRVQSVLAATMFVVIGGIGFWYINNKMVIPVDRIEAALGLFISSIFSLVFVILQVPYSSVVVAKEKMDFYAIVSVLNSGLTLLISILIRYSKWDHLIMYGFLLASVQLVVLLIYVVYGKRISSELKIERSIDISLLKSMLRFSSWNLFGAGGNVMKEQGVNLILNLFCGPVVNAARGIATQVNGGFQGLVSNLNIAVRPQVTQSYAQGNILRTMSLTYSISKMSSFVLFMFSYPILLEIDYVLSVWLGDSIPEYTSVFIIIIVLTTFFNNLNSAISGVVHSSGKMRKYQIVGSCVNLLALPLIYFLLEFGCSPDIALWSLLLISFLVQVAALVVLKSIVEYSFKDYASQVIIPIILVVVMSIFPPYILHYYMNQGVVRFIVLCTFTILEITFIIYRIGLSKAEKEMVRTMIAGVLKKNKELG